jgi:Tfp pilus assembly protein PilN
MIEINLLPPEIRAKQAKASGFDPRFLVYLIPVVVGILLVIHLALGLYALVRGYQAGVLSRQWQKLEPQRKELDAFKQQYETLTQDTKIADALAGLNINWSEKLNKLSLALPSGIWFESLTASRKEFVLKGTVVSLQKQEMSLLNKFLDGLKKDPSFIRDFKGFDVTSFQVKTIGGYDTLAFTIAGSLRS